MTTLANTGIEHSMGHKNNPVTTRRVLVWAMNDGQSATNQMFL
jgi:hypothetical protein